MRRCKRALPAEWPDALANSASQVGAFDRSRRGCISRAHRCAASADPRSLPPWHKQPPAHGAENGHTDKQFWALALGSIGVVYGDIGTSPLYALREAVTAAQQHGARGPEAVLGILSLIVWTMVLIVTLKYVLVLLNADNKGEGGTFALMALGQSVAKRSAPLILVLGVVGAAFFYGDAVITPAISVLSAVEGLKLVAPQLERCGAADHGRHPGRLVRRAVARDGSRSRSSSGRSRWSGSSCSPSAA